MRKILIIEDTPKHINDAIKFFVDETDAVVLHATNLEEALEKLEEVDGVISDIHFPTNNRGWDDPEPCGVAMMMICRERKIPCVLISSIWHHGYKNQWIHEMLGHLELPGIIDYGKRTGNSWSSESETKAWNHAWEKLKELWC